MNADQNRNPAASRRHRAPVYGHHRSGALFPAPAEDVSGDIVVADRTPCRLDESIERTQMDGHRLDRVADRVIL